MDEDFDTTDEWKPPTDAELKVINARRERSDKISKKMGEYMLKGHTMLGSSCSVCGTIEMKDRQGKVYCIACTEIDSDENAKDNPVLNRYSIIGRNIGSNNMLLRFLSHVLRGKVALR